MPASRSRVRRDPEKATSSGDLHYRLGLPAALVLIDVLFILTHVGLRLTSRLDDFPSFSLARDGGYLEWFMYAKEAWVAAALFFVAIRLYEYRYLTWSALFGFLLIDDSLGLHELIGAELASTMSLTTHLGMRGQDFGEMGGTALIGGALLLGLAVCYWRGSENYKTASRHLFALLAIIVFFGVGIDSLHFLYEINWKVSLLVVVIEDGGEMLGMSLAAWYAMRLMLAKGKVEKSLLSVFLGK